MENEKKVIIRIMSGLVAVTLAGGSYFVLKTSNAYAKGSKIVTSKPNIKYKNLAKHKIGEFFDEKSNTLYYTVEVIENDNASKISEVIIAVYNKEKQIPKEDLMVFDAENSKTTRSSFWPAVVRMNTEPGKKFRIHPGDILIFPTEYSEFKKINGKAKSSGWFSKYTSSNNIYSNNDSMVIPMEETRKMVEDIYKDMYPESDICVDEDFLRSYLRAHDYNGKYVLKDDSKLDSEEVYGLTEWIPTLEELDEYKAPKQKKKSR